MGALLVPTRFFVAALASCTLAAAEPLPRTLLARGNAVRPSEPISGLAAIVARRDIHYLVLGDSHGTQEIPVFFGDLVAQAQLSRPIVVALELPTTEADRTERYLRSPGGEEDRRGLLDGEFWRSTAKDGRGSQAMVDLIEKCVSCASVAGTAPWPIVSRTRGSPRGHMSRRWPCAGRRRARLRPML